MGSMFTVVDSEEWPCTVAEESSVGCPLFIFLSSQWFCEQSPDARGREECGEKKLKMDK